MPQIKLLLLIPVGGHPGSEKHRYKYDGKKYAGHQRNRVVNEGLYQRLLPDGCDPIRLWLYYCLRVLHGRSKTLLPYPDEKPASFRHSHNLLVGDPWIKPGVNQVDDEVDDHDHQGYHED